MPVETLEELRLLSNLETEKEKINSDCFSWSARVRRKIKAS
jgi:hypothetical protein